MATRDTLLFPAGTAQREIDIKVRSDGKNELPLLRIEAMALLMDVLRAVEELPEDKDRKQKVIIRSALLVPGRNAQGTGYTFALEFKNYDMNQVKSKIKEIKDGHRAYLETLDHDTPLFKTKSEGNVITFVTYPPDDIQYMPDITGMPMSVHGGGGTLPTDLTFMWPVIGDDGEPTGKPTSPFGMRGGRMHNGQDIAAPQGTPIVATRSGKVIVSDYVGAYGNAIYIDHGDMGGRRTTTRYAHNHENLVSQGEEVRQGQQIALMGSTGRSTGPHLHFEIRIDGEPVDPMPYISKEETAAALESARATEESHHGPQRAGYPEEDRISTSNEIISTVDRIMRRNRIPIPSYVWFPIMMEESRGDPTTHNPRGEDSHGLFQINLDSSPQYSDVNLQDPAVNAEAILDLWNRRILNSYTHPDGISFESLSEEQFRRLPPGEKAKRVWLVGSIPAYDQSKINRLMERAEEMARRGTYGGEQPEQVIRG